MAETCDLGGTDGFTSLDVDQTVVAALIGMILLYGLIAMFSILAVSACRLRSTIFGIPVGHSFPKLASALDITYGELVLLAAYLFAAGLPVILSLIWGQAPSTLAEFVGKHILLNLAFIVFPVTRTSLWVRLFGISFERAVKYHRVLAWWTIVAMWIHFLLFLIPVGACVLDNEIGENPPLYGLAATVIFTFTALLALEPIRRKFFELFRVSHLLFVVAFIFTILHTKNTVWYMMIPTVLYAFDIMTRVARRCMRWEVVSVAAHGSVTVLEVQSPLHFAYAAGQYCFVQIPEVSGFQWHPFSIVSDPTARNARGCVVKFAMKANAAGSWTERLNTYVKSATEVTSQQGASHVPAQVNLRVRVDGPFGILSNGLIEYSRVVLVAGGIGATPIISIYQYLCSVEDSCNREIVLLWVARDVRELAWASSMINCMPSDPQRTTRVHLYATSAQGPQTLGGLTVDGGRPNLDAIVPIANNRPGATFIPPEECVVVASGPEPLVRKAQDVALIHGYAFKDETFLL